jgi:uncharacterized protein YqgC (DUF456 family)
MARRGRKSEAEARIERITWALMVGVFGILYIVPEGTLPNPFVPFSGAVILIGAAVYQYGHGWRVSPITWMSGTLMLLLALYNLTVDLDANFYGVTLMIFAGVIFIGVITGET